VLANHNLHFELLTRSAVQYTCAAELVAKAPKNLTIVMQHVGGANMTNATEFPIWKDYINKLAAHPNVVAKISGVPERAVGANRKFDDWTEDQVKPYIEYCFQSFGPDRVVFGGNWFVVTRFSTFLRWTDVLSKIITEMKYSAADLKKFLNSNPQRVYRVA
jgi:L-fuconolactonase